MSKPRVGIFFGGRSVEHEVSIVTGFQAIEAVNREKYDVIPVYIGRDNVFYTGKLLESIKFFRQDHPPLNQLTRVLPSPDASRGKLILTEANAGLLGRRHDWEIDVVLPCTHGTFVEDGCLQGIFEMSGVPYAGSNVRGSSVGMDKELTKAVLAAARLPHLPYEIVRRGGDTNAGMVKIETALGYPVIVKPAVLGSSVAVTQATDREGLDVALDLALRFCDRALVEPAVIDAIEINCSVLDGDPPIASVLEQPIKPGAVLSFEEKYKAGGGKKGGIKAGGGKGLGMAGQQRLIPAPLEEDVTARIKELAIKTFLAIGGGGVARVDFLIDKAGNIYVNELNNIPGSLSYYLWEPFGKSFGDLIDRMIERAFEVNKQRNRTTFSFEANLLAGR